VKQRKPLPRPVVIALIVVGVFVVSFAGYTILVKPKKAEAAKLEKDAVDKQATLDQYHAEAANHQVVPKIRVADVYRLARAMPATVGMPDILLELDSLARSAGIELNSISPATATSGNGFQIVPITLQFDGDYYSITDLLYRLRNAVSVRHGRLEASGRIFSIKTVNLTPQGDSKLTASVTVQTFVYGAPATPGVAVAPVASTTTSSTDTSSTTTTAPSPPASTGASAEGAP